MTVSTESNYVEISALTLMYFSHIPTHVSNLKWLKEEINLLEGNWLSFRINGKSGESTSEWEPRGFKQLRTQPSHSRGTDAGSNTHISTVSIMS